MNIPYKNRTYKDIEAAKCGVFNGNYDDYVRLTSRRIIDNYNFCNTDIVLDIGSGLGDIAKAVSPLVHEVYCCDINEQYLSYAKQNCQGMSNVSFHLVSDTKLPLSFLLDDTITKAYAHAVFIHNCTEMMINYLHELKRVLKPGGIFKATYCVENKAKDVNPEILESNEKEITDTLNLLNFDILTNTSRKNKNSPQLPPSGKRRRLPDGSVTLQQIKIKNASI